MEPKQTQKGWLLPCCEPAQEPSSSALEKKHHLQGLYVLPGTTAPDLFGQRSVQTGCRMADDSWNEDPQSL